MRLSRRPLPEPDASVDALSDEDRQLLAYAWERRAAAELTGSLNFQVVAEALRAAHAEPAVQELALRAVDDEKWHSEICHRLATIFRGHEASDPTPDPAHVPPHEGASDELRYTLHVVGQCCLSETTGSAFYETCLRAARSKLARAAMRALLSDEVDHGRIGWAHLASPQLSPEVRRGVQRWLPSLIAANLRSWRNRAHLPDRPTLVDNGCPPFEIGDRAVVAALEDLIKPGMQRLGFAL
jgi:hypothetical protein